MRTESAIPAKRRLTVAMTLKEAKEIAGTLGRTTKMPGYSYGLDAFRCQVGGDLAEIEGSTCYNCYARKNFYQWGPAVIARERRHAGLDHPRWVDAMVLQISHYCAKTGELYFRWHDSGDLQSVDHLDRIVQVCRRTPEIRHWIPTRENGMVAEWLAQGNEFPSNLVVRISARRVGSPPSIQEDELEDLPTSTVHLDPGEPVMISERRKDSIECGAYRRGGECGSCRACWNAKVQNVSYLEH